MKIGIDDVMAWEPCKNYDRARVAELFAGRETLSAMDILNLDIPDLAAARAAAWDEARNAARANQIEIVKTYIL